MSYLQNIERLYAEGNLGGLVEIRVARKADFESIPDPSNGVVYGDLTFKEGAGWVVWRVNMETPGLRSTERTTKEGTAKSNVLEFAIAKDRPAIRHQLELAQRDEFVVLYRDGNNNTKLFGLLHAPVRFEFNHDTGKQHANLNAYGCRFYYDGPDNSVFYNGAVSDPPAGPAPAIVKYNGEVIATLAPGETLNIDSDFDYNDFEIVAS